MSLPHAKLPDKATLEKIYVVEGLSFAEIAARYDVKPKTVYNTMKLRAQKAGTTWPLKQGRRPDWRHRAASKRWDSVTAVMVRAEIREFCTKTGTTRRELAAMAGLTKGTVEQISCGSLTRISRQTAEKVMAAIEAAEIAEKRRKGAEHARNVRISRLAS